jgi:hypothetical protein
MLQCASFRDVLKVFIYVDQREIIFFVLLATWIFSFLQSNVGSSLV